MRKELKLKQKTLSTYEYLMKLPAEQEQAVIKCKHCPKFFAAKSYLKKHYDRNHPDKDYYKDFRDEFQDRGKDNKLKSPERD
jgi:Pyruvate/2-oxoacid:ferredoxin oxidoreductase delta subunit